MKRQKNLQNPALYIPVEIPKQAPNRALLLTPPKLANRIELDVISKMFILLR